MDTKEEKPKFLQDVIATKLFCDVDNITYVKKIISAVLKIDIKDVEDLRLVSTKVSNTDKDKQGESDAVFETDKLYINIDYNRLDAKNESYIYHLPKK